MAGDERRFSEGASLISTTDLDGVIQYCNKDFVEISGYSEKELMGSNHNIVRHPDMPKAAFEDLWSTIKRDQAWQGLVKNRCKNGDYYWVDAYVTAIFQNNKKVGYQSVRTCPSRQQIQEATALYQKLNSTPGMKLPKPSFYQRIELKTKVNAMLLLTFLMVIISGIGANYLSGLAYVLLDVLIVLLFGVLYWLVNFKTLRPITRLTQAINRISSGDLTEHIQNAQNDEVGQTFMSVKILQNRLKAVIGRFSESTHDLAIATDVLSETSYQTQLSMERQHSETDLVATAMTEMSATVTEVAQNTAMTSELAASADTTARHGKDIVESTCSTIQALSDELSSISQTVDSVADDSEKIRNITDTISSIADQTNLLALNAAIEAARAGEMGRGFAVVADEVRVLASRTQQATVEIKEMIDTLNMSSRSAVTAMGQGLERVNESVAKIQETESAFTQIVASVVDVNDMNTQIATAAEEQSCVADEMNMNIQSISDQSYKTNQNTQQLERKTQELTEMTASLEVQLRQYNLGESAEQFDFSEAKRAHLNWKSKVRDYLQGDTSAISKQEACSHRECKLGRWYYAAGMKKYQNSSHFKNIEAPHARLHQIVKQVMHLQEQGENEKAEALYRELEPISDEIVNLLDKTEKSL